MCLEDKVWVSSRVYLQDINKMKKEEMVCKFKMSYPDEIMSLSLPFICAHGYVKMHRRRSSPIVDYGGAIRKTSSKHKQERRSILVAVKIIIIKLKWNAQG